ncbi:hypothetical protein Gotur_014244 [Gossypium turneri]
MPSYSSGVGYGRLGPYLTFTVTGDSALEKMNIPWLILSLQIFIFFSLNRQLAFGADTISANQSLSGTQTIVSSGGHFVLGFFKPGNSSNYYIGMWYGKVNQQTAVWVANREIPVHDIHSSELKISNGNLVLFNESQVPIWSTNISSSSSNSVVAVLEDGGNLVLKDGPKSSTPLWQSLDHPTHTWLLVLDPNGTNQSFILWNRSEQYWTSGAWDPQRRIFSLVPEMRLNEIYNYSYVSNENESYFTYSLYDPSTISRFVMDVSGQMKQLSWLESSQRWSLIWSEPRQQCEVYAFCGAFGSCNEKALPFCNCLTGFEPKSESDWNLSDFSKGCKRKTQLQCEDPTLAHGKSDKFLEMPNIKLPQHEQSMTVGSISECESTCLKNCSCNVEAILCWAFLEIYHCDIKPENILLDAEFCPKVADFGLAKLVGRDFSRVLTTMRGTRGYLAPEWISGVAITPKADVYSYGMMLFEIVSGRRNSQQCEDGKVRFIPTWAASLITEGGDVLSLLDPRLNGVAPVEEISRLCKVACWCIQDAETQRPSMGQVVQMLEGVLDLHLPPVPRSLQVLVDEQEHVLLLSESSSAESSQSRSYISTPSHAKSSTSSTTS